MTLPGFLFFPCLMDQQAAEMPVSKGEVSLSFFLLKPKGQTAGRVARVLWPQLLLLRRKTSLRVTIWDWT